MRWSKKQWEELTRLRFMVLASLGLGMILGYAISQLVHHYGTESGLTGTAEGRQCQHSGSTLRCVRYLSNTGGGVIRFEIPGIPEVIGDSYSVAISGILAPRVESKDDCEKKAVGQVKRFIKRKLTKATQINLQNVSLVGKQAFKATILVDGMPLKRLLIEDGMAFDASKLKREELDWCTG